jgi:hypothetical protein
MLATWSVFLTLLATSPDTPAPTVGINLAPVEDYSRQWAFVDTFKQSRPWIESPKGKIAYDEHGWPLLRPGQSVQTLMLRELKGHYPDGIYTCTFSGPALVRMDQHDIRRTRDYRYRIDAQVTPGDGGLLFTARDAAVKNVHVWMPGAHRMHTFHPYFLQRLEPFGIIRFMDWQRTNHSKLVKWSQRAKPDDARYSTPAGVPVEVMVELANTRRAHPWFCIPHQTDDDFVREFAKIVKDKLRPELKVYVEYSNEVWNWSFEQTHWASAAGKKRALGDPEVGRFYAERSVEVFKIWEDVLGKDRLVRVLASQFVNSWLTEETLKWKDAYKHADVLAVAPYFGHEFGDPKLAGRSAKLSVDELFKQLEKEVEGKNVEQIEAQVKLAKKYGLRLIAYEGGQHLVGGGGAENNEALTRLFIAANRDRRMAELYRKHLQHWADAGGGEYVLYNYVTAPGKWGCWGLLEYQNQLPEDAPKYRAVVEWMKRTK